MINKNILIPLSLTLNDEKSLKFIINRFSMDTAVTLTLFHAYTPVLEIDVRNNPIMEKMNQNLSYQRGVLNDKKEALQRTMERLLTEGFNKTQVKCVFIPIKMDVAQEIVRFAKAEGVDLIVLSRTPSRVIRFFTPSVSKKVAGTIGKGVEVIILT